MKNSRSDFKFGDEVRIIMETLIIVFTILKLDGVIDWSWILVFAPLWITSGIAVLIIIILFVLTKILK